MKNQTLQCHEMSFGIVEHGAVLKVYYCMYHFDSIIFSVYFLNKIIDEDILYFDEIV